VNFITIYDTFPAAAAAVAVPSSCSSLQSFSLSFRGTLCSITMGACRNRAAGHFAMLKLIHVFVSGKISQKTKAKLH